MRRRRAQGNLPADSSASRNAGLLDAIYSLPNAGRLLFGVGAETFGVASSALGFGFAVILWLRTRGRETAPRAGATFTTSDCNGKNPRT